MPIGVPRIIYCWGEELPAQWTDIYNFIFRRRMVFLMQYLDDELCNQICGLLINIHMEDRSKELEKKEMEKSGLFQSSNKSGSALSQDGGAGKTANQASKPRSAKSVEDLLTSEDDLAIDQNHMLEQYTLQKITMEWLNWNAQFFDYSDEPYLFYLADILSKDFGKDTGNFMYNTASSSGAGSSKGTPFGSPTKGGFQKENSSAERRNGEARQYSNPKNYMNHKFLNLFQNMSQNETNAGNAASGSSSVQGLDVYSPFRSLANFAAQYQSYDINSINPLMGSTELGNKNRQTKTLFEQYSQGTKSQSSNSGLNKLLHDLSQQKISKQYFDTPSNNTGLGNGLSSSENEILLSQKALSQRNLKREYLQDRVIGQRSSIDSSNKSKPFNYLDSNSYTAQSYDDYRQYYRKQTEKTIQEEESKKVFVIINSFGGSVGNGITVHDALQFIKAGSLTLGLGVAASAASLVLAGGTIGERYVTEGCHVMIHQPEGGLNGQASDIWIDANEIMKIRLDVAEIYSLSTYRPRHKILRDLDRDFYLTATETIQYGLADEIATNEVMHEIIEMTSKVWDFHDSQQQRLLESRQNASSGMETSML
jgi:ATP-dependent Clp protease protease subunit